MIELLSPIAGDLADSPLNVSVFAVDGKHVLAILFDAEVSLETVQSVGRAACASLSVLLA